MKVSGFPRSVFVFACVTVVVGAGSLAKQVPTGRAAANKIALKKLVEGSNQISPGVRRHLSQGMQDYHRGSQRESERGGGQVLAPSQP